MPETPKIIFYESLQYARKRFFQIRASFWNKLAFFCRSNKFFAHEIFRFLGYM